MQRIRCKDTSPELIVRRLVGQLGFRSRYRVCSQRLPGRPDLVFPTLRKIIFVHGCFWHSHLGCDLTHLPLSRRKYWDSKLKGNVQRDRTNLEKLEEIGWRVLVLWECQLSDEFSVARQVAKFLKQKIRRGSTGKFTEGQARRRTTATAGKRNSGRRTGTHANKKRILER